VINAEQSKNEDGSTVHHDAMVGAGRVERPIVRLLHTSDVHLSSSQHSKDAFQAAIDIAIDHSVDVLLIAGDLFDNSRLGPEVTDWTIDQLRRLQQPAVIIPGNHDCVDETSIYHRVDLTAAGDHVYVVADPRGSVVRFENLQLTIWARGIQTHSPSNRPLLGYQPDDPSYWRIVMTHGHYVPVGEVSDRSSQIDEAEIAELDCDYVALGHWHRFLDLSVAGVAAFYCGSPSESAAGAASVNLVELHPTFGISVRRVPVFAEIVAGHPR
jgi:DNA repair protein SbcD/Mre11